MYIIAVHFRREHRGHSTHVKVDKHGRARLDVRLRSTLDGDDVTRVHVDDVGGDGDPDGLPKLPNGAEYDVLGVLCYGAGQGGMSV